MLTLYKFHWHCGRMGDIDSLFIAEPDEVAAALNRRVVFGDVLGKFSDIAGTLEEGDLLEVTSDPVVVGVLIEKLGPYVCGLNPLNHLQEE